MCYVRRSFHSVLTENYAMHYFLMVTVKTRVLESSG